MTLLSKVILSHRYFHFIHAQKVNIKARQIICFYWDEVHFSEVLQCEWRCLCTDRLLYMRDFTNRQVELLHPPVHQTALINAVNLPCSTWEFLVNHLFVTLVYSRGLTDMFFILILILRETNYGNWYTFRERNLNVSQTPLHYFNNLNGQI